MSTLELTPEEILLLKKMVADPQYWFAVKREMSETAAATPWRAFKALPWGTFKALADKVSALDVAQTPATNNLPECNNMTGTKTCARPVTHRDERGFIYCTPCGLRRKQYERCRKLTATELRELASNNRPRAGQAETATQIKTIQYWWDNRSHNWIITLCDGEKNQVGDAVFAPNAKLASLEVALLEQEYPDAKSIKLSSKI